MVELLYDLNEKSQLREEFDPLGIQSINNGEGQDQIVDTQIINVLIPEAFKGVLPISASQTAVLCLDKRGTGRVSRYNKCKLSFKARIVGTMKRMPGFYDISGYTPAAYLSPGVLIS